MEQFPKELLPEQKTEQEIDALLEKLKNHAELFNTLLEGDQNWWRYLETNAKKIEDRAIALIQLKSFVEYLDEKAQK
ncbi:MAG: hypothetical protein AAB432_02330 [Patescibacteria group bacterium]